MTGRLGSMAVDGTPISVNDVSRMNAEEELHAEWQRKAVLVIAASADDAADCRLLLSILGLDPEVVADARRAAKDQAAGPAPGRRPSRAA